MSKTTKVLLGLAISVACASGANAAQFTLKNECSDRGSKLSALVYDEADFAVTVPIASVKNLPKGRKVPLDGLISGNKYKIHITGSCEVGGKVKFLATNIKADLGTHTCPSSGTVDFWMHDKKPGMDIECKI